MYGFPGAFVTLWEDFLLDNVSETGALSNWLETAAGGASQDIANVHGGVWRQTIGGDDGDDCLLAGEVVWEVDEGQPLVYETRIKMSAITGIGIYTGMSDANTEASGVNPIEDEGGTLATAATDAFGFMLDESSAGTQDTTWQAVGVQNDTDNAQVSLTKGAAVAADTYQVLRLEASTADSGTVRYYIGTADEMGGGTLVSTQTSWFRSGILYCPIFGADDRAVATNVDTDYVFVQAPRT